MPYSDRKKSPKVSQLAKETELEVCKTCGTLHPWGQKCPNCGRTLESFEHRLDAYKRGGYEG